VSIYFKPTADAPIMKKKKWEVERNITISDVTGFFRSYLTCAPHESLFLYINQCFAPAPDMTIGSLYDCYGSDRKITFYYCKNQAWG
ncbi:hypothetical protein HELRODRAFT_68015, partial [Helobdella robusta]|uniref:Ubiquitin-like protein ATG12 n=1 Tax=Helobdella robusta TaxID=6412 RepID=T1FZ92_HELRO